MVVTPLILGVMLIPLCECYSSSNRTNVTTTDGFKSIVDDVQLQTEKALGIDHKHKVTLNKVSQNPK